MPIFRWFRSPNILKRIGRVRGELIRGGRISSSRVRVQRDERPITSRGIARGRSYTSRLPPGWASFRFGFFHVISNGRPYRFPRRVCAIRSLFFPESRFGCSHEIETYDLGDDPLRWLFSFRRKSCTANNVMPVTLLYYCYYLFIRSMSPRTLFLPLISVRSIYWFCGIRLW